jgi:hypothetical protein
MSMSAVKGMPVQAAGQAAQAASDRRTQILRALTVITILAVAGGFYMGLTYPGTEINQGEVQRIFYFHVAVFSGAFVAFCATVVGGVLYLWKREAKWDALAVAGVEVGLTLALMNLVTGMIWARPIWNTWWTWDPRLTQPPSCADMPHLMLRNGIDNPEQRRSSHRSTASSDLDGHHHLHHHPYPSRHHPSGGYRPPARRTPRGGFEMTDAMRSTLAVNSAIWASSSAHAGLVAHPAAKRRRPRPCTEN